MAEPSPPKGPSGISRPTLATGGLVASGAWSAPTGSVYGIMTGMSTTTTAANPNRITVPRLANIGNYKDEDGNSYTACCVKEHDMILTARWCGARVHATAGLRVPTLEGVEVAFVGDWIVRDADGIVYIYTDEDFKRDFRALTSRDF